VSELTAALRASLPTDATYCSECATTFDDVRRLLDVFDAAAEFVDEAVAGFNECEMPPLARLRDAIEEFG
jgi:hypothetical protein